MKRYLIIQMCQAALGLSAIASPVVQEVTVYPFAATITHQADLVIEEYVPLDTKRPGKKWTFQNPNVSKRTVWRVTAESNTVFNAWLDTDGNGKYDVGEPFGTSAGRDYPEIELTRYSPVTPRIDLVSGASDSGQSFESILADAIEHNPDDRQRLINNKIVSASISSGQRIRVVRWLINNVPVRAASTTPYVVLDRKIETDVRSCFTEADILDGSENAFDLDWATLYRDIINDGAVRRAIGGEVTRMCYLIVVGDGDVGWDLATSTNVVKALPTAIVRKFMFGHDLHGAVEYHGRAKPSPLTPTVQGSRVSLMWKMDHPDAEYYTAYRAKVLSGGTEVHDTGLFRNPARWDDGSFHWTITNAIPSGTYNWKIAAYNSKFSNEQTSAYTNGVPFTVTGE